MAIVDPVGAGEKFSQGDILDKVTLYTTGKSWETGGVAARAKYSQCLVLSRPCNCEPGRGPVIVLGVQRMKDQPPANIVADKDYYSYEKALYFLKKHRDGHDAPDHLYLGQLPNLEGRYSARFDSIHTIEVPQAKADLDQFVSRCRI